MGKNKKIADFYGRYPYPKVDAISFDKNLHDQILYLGERCHSSAITRRGSQRGRMLVAGAGTREAVTWAHSLPHFDVHAVDLSDRSIEIATLLAEQIGLTNIRFSKADIQTGEGLEGPYDFISSFGVLHHLRSPESGLAQLEQRLAPGGLMALMLYNHTNRRALQEAQRAIGLLTQGLDADATESVALAVCRTGITDARRLSNVFRLAVADHQAHPQEFADTMLNPQEVSYSIPELAAFFATCGLELKSPVEPASWFCQGPSEPALLERFEKLTLVQQLEYVDLLNAPLFWMVVGRRDGHMPRPCRQDPELFWQRVPLPFESGAFKVSELEVDLGFERFGIAVERLADGQVQIFRDPRFRKQLPAIAARLIAGVDGKRTLREISEQAAKDEGTEFDRISEALAGLWEVLIDVLTVAVPDISRCEACRRQTTSQSPSP